MIFTKIEELAKLKTAQLTEVIEQYKKVGGESLVVPEKFANNPERIEWIEKQLEATGSIPHTLTEADVDNNAIDYGEAKVGDVILLPIPQTEDEVRALMLEEAEILLSDEEETVAVARMQELTALDTIALGTAVAKMKDGDLGLTPAENKETTPKPDETAKVDTVVEKPQMTQPEPVSDATGEVSLEEAIKTGKFMYENSLIIGARPKIFAGQTRYALYGAGGQTFVASKKDVEVLIKNILG